MVQIADHAESFSDPLHAMVWSGIRFAWGHVKGWNISEGEYRHTHFDYFCSIEHPCS